MTNSVLNLSHNKSLNIRSYGRKVFKRAAVHPPRSIKMPTDQDWPSVWPVARSFHPASVPLPLHQGWVVQGTTGKFANAELMKIPNFLHLTPPTIERQCQALKSEKPAFCKKHFRTNQVNMFNFLTVRFC
jgi:small subunit ribosomal protein S35